MKSTRLAVVSVAVFTAIFVLGSSLTASAQTQQPPTLTPEQAQQLNKLPMKDFGEVLQRIQKELVSPAPLGESRLLPLLPESTVFYAAFPNYGAEAQQALKIFREERQSRPALRDWWQSPDMAKAGPQMEQAVEQLGELSQYLGDEVVVSGALNGQKPPSVVAVAQVRKPGFKQALEQMIQHLPGPNKPAVRVLDKQSLATAVESTPHEMMVLVRPDYVVVAGDVETLRKFSQQLDSGTRAFASTEFAHRLQRSYANGLTMLAGVDLQRILRKAPIPPDKDQTLQQLGFADVKYLVWEHKGGTGRTTSEAELSFTGPRRGIASWMAAPRNLGSLDFASPKAVFVTSIGLKNLGDIFEDIRTLATATKPDAFASLDQMQQGLRMNLKDDLLSQFGGEITLEVDNLVEGQPAWKAILQVNDAARVQQTLGKLLLMGPFSPQESSEGSVIYHTLTVPSPKKATEVSYAFADGYLVIASSVDAVREAVGFHRNGGSLAKSSKFLAALPPGHSAEASALYYSDAMKMMGLQLARFSPALAQPLFGGKAESMPVVGCAYADATSIRGVTASQGMDVGMFMTMAAVAIPNLVRAKTSANEAAVVGAMRTIVTAQVSYQATYPGRGYSRDLASLGVNPLQPGAVSPKHAGLIDSAFAKTTCTAGTWCEKSGYKFTFSPVCPKLLCQEFVAVATPLSPSNGGKNFCATSDGVVRFRAEAPLIAPLLPSQCRAWAPVQ